MSSWGYCSLDPFFQVHIQAFIISLPYFLDSLPTFFFTDINSSCYKVYKMKQLLSILCLCNWTRFQFVIYLTLNMKQVVPNTWACHCCWHFHGWIPSWKCHKLPSNTDHHAIHRPLGNICLLRITWLLVALCMDVKCRKRSSWQPYYKQVWAATNSSWKNWI